MIPTPGEGCDLNKLVDQAVANNTPDAILEEPFTTRPTTLLETVVIHRRYDLAKTLLSLGAVMSAEDLKSAIWWNCGAAMVLMLLEHGTQHNSLCVEIAAKHEKWDTVFVLLDYGANKESWAGQAPLLHAAVWAGNSKGHNAVWNLLERGVNLNSVDSLGMTPLMIACDSVNPVRWDVPYIKEAVEDLLLEREADVSLKNKWGETALLVCTSKKTASPKQRAKTVEKLTTSRGRS